jgi:UDP-glucose 4-epimerase
LDDLSTGERDRLPFEVAFEKGSTGDHATVDRTFRSHRIEGVVHLAAKKQVAESAAQPLLYFQENVEALRVLLDACVRHNVRFFLFSSSAAVYGSSPGDVIDEQTACIPGSVYGRTKLAGEWLTHSVGAAAGMATLALRYFNVAGAMSAALADRHGENLVPRVLQALRVGRPPVIFGDDYPTPDGTCVRDYVHVSDVADAHVAAVSALRRGELSGESVNIGTGRGLSVREVIDSALSITGLDITPVIFPRRLGDAPAVVAAVDRAADVLQWKAQSDVNNMIESSWAASRTLTAEMSESPS